MNKQNLNQSIQACLENAGIEVFFGMKDGNVFKANIRNEEQLELKQLFVEELNNKIVSDDEKTVMNISTPDDRRNVIYYYDLQIPAELEIMNKVITNENIQFFSFDGNLLSDINAIVIMLGNVSHQIVLYKQNYSINIFKKDSTFGLRRRRGENQFEKVDDDFLKLNSKFDFFKIGTDFFILELKTLERFFGFHEIIKADAEHGIQEIEGFDIIENPEELRALLDDVSFSRKLTRIVQNSPVLGHVENRHIIEFAKNHPALSGKLKSNPDGTKFKLDTKKSKKLFIKLLNDDFLTSDLTSKYYDSLAKDVIIAEE
jgi:hypothetical protein